jgi:hypothetical protein
MRFGTLTKFLFLLALPAAHAASDDDFVVYEAQHHSADELMKAAQGVSNGARVSNLGSKVVVYGTKSQRDGVLKVFAALDHAIGNYRVQLRLASHSRGSRDSAGVSGSVSPSAANVRANLKASDGEGSSGTVQEITVSDGGTAKLYSGNGIYPRTVAVHLRAIGHSGAHVEIRESDPNALGEQAMITELDVPLSEWRTIGGISGSNVVRSGEILSRTKRSSMSSEDVQMRVSPQP